MQSALAADPEPAAPLAAPAETPTEANPLGESSRSPAAVRGGDTVLYPADGDARVLGSAAAPADQLSTGWALAGVLLVGAGVWLWLQRTRLPGRNGAEKLIGIEETKSLGNRQFLVVASCDGRRLLLGVSPGRINTLADLDDLPVAAEVRK